MQRMLRYTVAMLVLATGACSDAGPVGISQAPSFAHLGGGTCEGVQGIWTASGNPMTGEFSGVIEGDLQGTTSTSSQITPPGITGRVVHGSGTHSIELSDGDVLSLESHWIIANGRLNASYTVVDGGHGSLTGHGLFNPAELVLKYAGSICR